MTIEERIAADMKDAMKRGDASRLETLRMLRAALKNRSLEKRARSGEAALSDEDTEAALMTEAKRRREAAALFREGNRLDLAEKEERERAVIEAYLPARMSREEIVRVVERLTKGGLREFGPLMQGVMKEVKGRAEGAEVSAVVRETIGR